MRTSSLHSRGSDDALGQWLSSGSVVRPHRRENELVSEDHPLLTTSAPSDDEWESLSAFDRSEPLCNILEKKLTEIDDALGPMRSPDVVEHMPSTGVRSRCRYGGFLRRTHDVMSVRDLLCVGVQPAPGWRAPASRGGRLCS